MHVAKRLNAPGVAMRFVKEFGRMLYRENFASDAFFLAAHLLRVFGSEVYTYGRHFSKMVSLIRFGVHIDGIFLIFFFNVAFSY